MRFEQLPSVHVNVNLKQEMGDPLWPQLVVSGLVGWALGLPPFLPLLLVFMAADVILGLLAAWTAGALSSTVSARGMAKKVGMLVLVGVCKAAEPSIGYPLAGPAAVFFCIHEALSLVENAGLLGIPIPPGLRDGIAKLRVLGGGEGEWQDRSQSPSGRGSRRGTGSKQ